MQVGTCTLHCTFHFVLWCNVSIEASKMLVEHVQASTHYLTGRFASRASLARMPSCPFHENLWYLLGWGGGVGGGGIGVGGVNGGSRSASTHVQELKVVVDDGVGGDGVGVRINMYSAKTTSNIFILCQTRLM